MPNNISREAINALLPPGAIWVPSDGLDLDLLLNGIAEGIELIRVDIADTAFNRYPLKTSILDDLELEFGILKDISLTEDERRNKLQSVKAANNGDGTLDFMEARLLESGFDLRVYANDPAVDPDLFINSQFQFHFNDIDNANFGNENMIFGRAVGLLVVNGSNDIDFVTPVDATTWPMIFFIGAPGAARDLGTGELVSIAPAQIPISRKDELIRLIVKYKPIYTWCGLVAESI